jgi:tetratricopeptide (TPR) repeat protein
LPEHTVRNHADRVQADGYHLLALAPGPGLRVAAAASLLALPRERTARVLHELAASGAVTRSAAGRYRWRGPSTHSPGLISDRATGTTRAARRRLVDHYLHTAAAADRLLSPSHPAVEVAPPGAGCVPERFASREAALEWLDAELDCLVEVRRIAAAEGFHAAVWQLAACLNGHFVRRGRSDEQLAQWGDALAAAQALGDPRAEILALRFSGQACTRAGMHTRAAGYLQRAVELATRYGDAADRGRVYYIFSWVREEAGDHRSALDCARSASDMFRAAGDPIAEADALNAVGSCHAQLGEPAAAGQRCAEALELARRHGYREGEAASLDSLGLVAQRAGRHADALDLYGAALVLCRELGNGYQEAGILERLGDSWLAAGRPEDARRAWSRALEIYRDQQRVAAASLVEGRLSGIAAAARPPAGPA